MRSPGRKLTTTPSGGGTFCRCAIASEWNVEGGRLCVETVVFLVLFGLMDVGLTDWDIVRGLCRDAGTDTLQRLYDRH